MRQRIFIAALLLLFVSIGFLSSRVLRASYYPNNSYIDSKTLVFEGELFTRQATDLGGTIKIADLNNDGYDDFITSYGRVAYGTANDGAVYIIWGGPHPTLELKTLIEGNPGSIFAAGGSNNTDGFEILDFNNDGKKDILVNNVWKQPGALMLYYGDNKWETTRTQNSADYTFTGTYPTSTTKYFGLGLGVGDVNNDHSDDIIVQKAYYITNHYEGDIYYYFGGTNPDYNSDFSVHYNNGLGSYMKSIETLSDINKDGKNEILIGNNVNNSYEIYNDPLNVYSQPPSLVFKSANVGAFGRSNQLSIVDINNDKIIDICFGDYLYDSAGTDNGRVACSYNLPQLLQSGGELQIDNFPIIITGNDRDNLGSAITLADVNNDGYPDLIAAAYQISKMIGEEHGYANIYLNNKNGSFNMMPWAHIPSDGSRALGTNIKVFDLDKDGYNNISISNYGDDAEVSSIEFYEINHTQYSFNPEKTSNTMTVKGSITQNIQELTYTVPEIILDAQQEVSFDSEKAYFPYVIYENGLYKMWYAGRGGRLDNSGVWGQIWIGYATSPDGINWTKYSSEDLCPQAPGIGCVLDIGLSSEWDGNHAYNAVVLHDTDDNIYKMWYGDWLGNESHIGYATSSDGIHWTKNPGNLCGLTGNGCVFPARKSVTNAWDSQRIYVKQVLKENGTFKMYYEGVGLGTYKTYMIGLATSTDGVHWTRYDDINEVSCNLTEQYDDGCIFSNYDDATTTFSSTSYPFVLKINGAYKMWYERSAFKTYAGGIYYASSVDGIHWSTLSSAPIISGINQIYSKGRTTNYPSVLFDAVTNKYKMWFSTSDTQTFRIAYAESNNETDWQVRTQPVSYTYKNEIQKIQWSLQNSNIGNWQDCLITAHIGSTSKFSCSPQNQKVGSKIYIRVIDNNQLHQSPGQYFSYEIVSPSVSTIIPSPTEFVAENWLNIDLQVDEDEDSITMQWAIDSIPNNSYCFVTIQHDNEKVLSKNVDCNDKTLRIKKADIATNGNNNYQVVLTIKDIKTDEILGEKTQILQSNRVSTTPPKIANPSGKIIRNSSYYIECMLFIVIIVALILYFSSKKRKKSQ